MKYMEEIGKLMKSRVVDLMQMKMVPYASNYNDEKYEGDINVYLCTFKVL